MNHRRNQQKSQRLVWILSTQPQNNISKNRQLDTNETEKHPEKGSRR
jgi:hypothetical protein